MSTLKLSGGGTGSWDAHGSGLRSSGNRTSGELQSTFMRTRCGRGGTMLLPAACCLLPAASCAHSPRAMKQQQLLSARHLIPNGWRVLPAAGLASLTICSLVTSWGVEPLAGFTKVRSTRGCRCRSCCSSGGCRRPWPGLPAPPGAPHSVHPAAACSTCPRVSSRATLVASTEGRACHAASCMACRVAAVAAC